MKKQDFLNKRIEIPFNIKGGISHICVHSGGKEALLYCANCKYLQRLLDELMFYEQKYEAIELSDVCDYPELYYYSCRLFDKFLTRINGPNDQSFIERCVLCQRTFKDDCSGTIVIRKPKTIVIEVFSHNTNICSPGCSHMDYPGNGPRCSLYNNRPLLWDGKSRAFLVRDSECIKEFENDPKS